MTERVASLTEGGGKPAGFDGRSSSCPGAFLCLGTIAKKNCGIWAICLLTVMEAIAKAKPAAAKGTYFKSATIATTMGPGIRLNTLKYGV